MSKSTSITPPYLKKGDTVAITCPAKKLPIEISEAVALLESWGLKVILGDTVYGSFHQYAGTDEERARDLQRFLDDTSVKAIFAARGGYGTIRIIDALDFTQFVEKPKWLIGFSDITVLHSHIAALYGIETIHGQMPLNVPDASKASLLSLRDALFGETIAYRYKSELENRPGTGAGTLIGGNLTLLMMMAGSVSEQKFDGKILFLEDVGEYLYSVDRMMWNLKRAGKLQKLHGLIVGGFTGIKDNDIPFGKSAEEIIMEHVQEYDYPVCFHFPAGHIDDNHALVFGREMRLVVGEYEVEAGYGNPPPAPSKGG